jgi:hypothetical protein
MLIFQADVLFDKLEASRHPVVHVVPGHTDSPAFFAAFEGQSQVRRPPRSR